MATVNVTVVYATDRSKAVVLVFKYSYFVWLCEFYCGAFHAESCLAFCSRVVFLFVCLFVLFVCLFLFIFFFSQV